MYWVLAVSAATQHHGAIAPGSRLCSDPYAARKHPRFGRGSTPRPWHEVGVLKPTRASRLVSAFMCIGSPHYLWADAYSPLPTRGNTMTTYVTEPAAVATATAKRKTAENCSIR